MTLKEFRNALLEQFLTFIWRQWSTLGVLGEARLSDDNWVVDPEALLVFSLQAARYDARLFDEILGWALTNAEWLDVSRLKNILSSMDGMRLRVMGGALKWLQTNGDKRKWQSMAQYCLKLYEKDPILRFAEPLFKDKTGVAHPEVPEGKADPDFLFFSINRPKVNMKTGEKTREVHVNTRTNLRFFLRSLFGVGGKSECLAYLLTHDGGRPRDMAQEIGLFWLGVQNTLSDLAKSGLVLTRSRGEKKVEYWLPQKRWWEFLTASVPDVLPRWVNWLSVFSTLSSLLDAADQLQDDEGLEEMKAMSYSEIENHLALIAREFGFSGYDVVPLSIMSMPEDLRKLEILKFLAKIFGVEVPSFISANVQSEGVYAKS